MKMAVTLAEALFEDTPANVSQIQPEVFRNAGVIFGIALLANL
jgi:hypothetical protein